MMTFLYPQFLILLLPLLWLYFKYFRRPGMVGIVRLLILLLIPFAMAQPQIFYKGAGRILLVLVDRSASMPPDSEKRIKEALDFIMGEKKDDDKVGILSFGEETVIESLPSTRPSFSDFGLATNQSASNLAHALEVASKILGNQKGKVLIISDGKYTGQNPLSLAHTFGLKKIPISFRYLGSIVGNDVAIRDLTLPTKVEMGKPFQFSLVAESNLDTQGILEIYREGKLIIQVPKKIKVGRNLYYFRDILPQGGSFVYLAKFRVQKDEYLQNNLALGVVQSVGTRRVLVVTEKGEEDNFTRALRAAKIPITVISPEKMPASLASLDKYKAICLENVSALKMLESIKNIPSFVEDLGGGLFITGGKQSFGAGGYYKSPLDPILPVSMELKKEHHKLKAAIAIALDRSGSMSASVGGGKTKMDLANMGTASVIELMTEWDEVSVIAVDSSPHVIVSMQQVGDQKSEIISKALSIQSTGGGIFTYTALEAAAKEVLKSSLETRHIILFADAADAEEPGSYKKLLRELQAKKITVTVIALGTPRDSDAAFLKDVARRGGGRIYFSEDPMSLPQIFAGETLTVMKSSFVDEPIQAKWMPGFYLISLPMGRNFPNLGGFNLTFLKPKASLALQTVHPEYQSPLLAAWYRGGGRVLAFTGEVDGRYTGALRNWPKYGDFFVTLVRWVMGMELPQDFYVESRRRGNRGEIYLEFEDESKAPPTVKVIDPKGNKMSLTWNLAPGGYKAEYPMNQRGIYFPILEWKHQNQKAVFRGPPLALPYGAEFLPEVQNRNGKEILEKLSKITKGQEIVHFSGLFQDIPENSRYQSLLPYLAFIILLLTLLEIGGRRVGLLSKIDHFLLRDWKITGQGFLRILQRSQDKKEKETSIQQKKIASPIDFQKVSKTHLVEEEKNPPPSSPVKGKEEEKEEDISGLFSKAKKQAQKRLDS